MKRVKYLVVACILVMAMVLSACNKNGELDIKGLIATDTPTPEESEKNSQATSTPEPTKAATPTTAPTATPTPEPTAVPTVTPTAVPTDVPTPTLEPVVTDEPTPTETATAFASEFIDYDEPETFTMGLSKHSVSQYNEELGKKLYELSYDKLILGEAEKEKYPNLALQFDVINMSNNDVVDYYNEVFYGQGESIAPEDTTAYVKSSYDIIRADSYVTSIRSIDSSYTGGVHPFTGITGVSIDTQTGEILKIKDVCNDCASLPEMIAYRLAEKYDAWEDEEDLDEVVSYIEGVIEADSLKFTVGYEGVTFYFTPYEIAEYAMGNLSVTIPFEESFVGETEDGPKMIGLFNKKFRTVPENYMMTMTFGVPVDLMDINLEKSFFSTLTVCMTPSEAYPEDGTDFYILINDEEKLRLDKVYFENGVINLIKAGNNKYVMIKTVQGSDDVITYVYNISENGEIFSSVGTNLDDYTEIQLASLKDVYGEDEYDFQNTYKNVYDPMDTKVNFRFDVVGTNFVSASVYFDPEKQGFDFLSPFFDFTYKWPLTLKKDFKAGMIDPELMFNGDDSATGEMDIEIELKAGDVIYLERCTGSAQRQVFFSTDSGEWGMFLMDDPSISGSFMINGEDIRDLFDGISFAD